MNGVVKGVILSILMFIHACCYAQWKANRIIKKYSIKEGLSQAVVQSISQDGKGLMWFATDDGVNRFDGYSFTHFRYDADNTKLPHDNFVQRVFRDSNKRLWMSSRGGLYKFDLSTEKFTQYYDNRVPNWNDVSYISEGSSGNNLWIAWYWGGVASFDIKSEKFTPYDANLLPSLTSTASIVVHEDSYGLLWVGSQDKGLNVFKVKDSKIQERVDDLSANALLPSLYIKCIQEDHLGNLWIGTTKGLVYFIRRENRFYVFSNGIQPGIPVFTLHEDSNKQLWIGTQGNGLYTIGLKDFDGRHLEKLVSHHVPILDQYNISQHTIRSIFEDNDKNIWIGTHGDGIYMIGSEEKQFLKIQTKLFMRSAESFVQYNGLCNDEDGFIWAGTDGEGIYKLKPNGEVIDHFTADGKPGSIKDNIVVSAYRDHNDDLWFGTLSHGMFLYNRGNRTFTQYEYSSSGSPVPLSNQVRMIFEDTKKNIWIGASRGGLCVVDRKQKVFKNHSGYEGLRSIDVRTIVEDKTGGLWFGCYGNGLNYYIPEKDQWTRYFDSNEEGKSLKSNIVYALELDKKNRLWIGTAGGGLSVYNTIDKSLKRYTDKDGLINNTIYALLVDDLGHVWVSTIKGISKFDPESEQFFNYTYFDGLQEGQFNPGSSLYNLQEGYMAFGGTHGLNLFYPLEIKNDAKIPDVRISRFQLFNKPIKVGQDSTEGQVLDKVIDETKVITLNHDQSVFTFEFTALNYSYPDKTKYAFKLEGLDRDWNYVGNQRIATYRYLRHGNYEFKVKATSQDNVWPKEYTSIRLVILPPFWKTPIAYSSYVIVIGLLIYAALILRRKQDLLGKRLRIEKTQRKRERQLVQEKLSFFTEVSHEFRTPLTLMIGPLEEILTREGNLTPTSKKLKMVYKNAHKLLNLINKLLDYRKAETGNMLLKVKEDNIVGFVEEIFITFKELAIRKHIHFEFYTEHPIILTWFDKEKLEMVLNNILSNSFKYIGKGDAISITVRKEREHDQNEKIVVEIKDNGIGIPKDQLKYIFDWFYQANSTSPMSSGIGLALAKKLIYLHKGQIYAESKEGQGSVFTIKIPIGKEQFLSHEIVIDDRHEHLLDGVSASLLADVEDTDHRHKKGMKSVLIVEDDDEVRLFLKDYFKSNYKIYESVNGKEGLPVAIEHNPDLIISDIMMPEMNGIDFCKQVKGNIKTSHIPVILLTAKTSFTHHKEGLEIGADAYVTKPFSPEMLSLTINNLLQSQENLKRFYKSMFITNGIENKEIVSPDEKLLQRLYEILKANLEKTDFNLDDVADQLNMSRSLFYKKIKTLTGLSPLEYMRSLKLAEAANLLSSQKYKVFEVVYMVGFSDIKYFRKCFIKEFGYPPSQLLKK